MLSHSDRSNDAAVGQNWPALRVAVGSPSDRVAPLARTTSPVYAARLAEALPTKIPGHTNPEERF